MIKFYTSEYKLWWMIINQTLFDLQSSALKAGAPSKRHYSLYESCNLRSVLRDIHSPWMRQVCSNVDLDYYKFLKIVEKIVHKKINIGDYTGLGGKFNRKPPR